MVTVPSGAIETYALKARRSWACAVRVVPTPTVNAKASPAEAPRNSRRLTLKSSSSRGSAFFRIAFMSRLLRGALDGAHDAGVGAAAADVAIHVLDDLRA